MKIIDIMQKIANGEIFKFRVDGVDNYYVDRENYICEEDGTRVKWYIDDTWLNMDAKIIEDTKIEKLDIYDELQSLLKDNNIDVYNLHKMIKKIELKQNEIIDKLNEED